MHHTKIDHTRILLLDGAMGTVIQEYGLAETDFRGSQFSGWKRQLKGNNDVLCLTRPDVVADIHERYLKAGADIISTNTFNAQRISQTDYGLETYCLDINRAGARLAREAADRYSTASKPRYVAGSMGPTNKTCSMSPDVNDPSKRNLTYEELKKAYIEQACGLIEGGADLLLVETIFDTLNAKAAIAAAQVAMDRTGKNVPLMLSLTVSDKAGRTLSGQTIGAFLTSVDQMPAWSVGLNCSFGAEQMVPYLRELARNAPCLVSCHPNAGLPNELGQYDETPESMARQMETFLDERLVNIIGGCCGTTPDFISRFATLIEGRSPHRINDVDNSLRLSGLDVLNCSNGFVNIGERCNVAGSRKFLRLIKEKNYEEALGIARKQVEDGALVLDINMDDGLIDARAEMTNFLNRLAAEPDIARVPFMIDSSAWEVVKAGLACVQGKSVVNSISLKEGEETFLRRASEAMMMGAAVVVMCFDEQGQATTYERRIEIAGRAYVLLTEKVGMKPQNIIFDPNILAVATGIEEHNRYALDFIRAAKWIRENLPGVHVSGGVSNLSFAFRGNNYLREAMHAVFLYHAMQAGMDFGIVNPATKVTYDDLPTDLLEAIEDVILCRKDDAAERLTSMAQTLLAGEAAKGGTGNEATEAGLNRMLVPVEERLTEALIKGTGENLDEDLKEALQKYDMAVDIIEGPLMAGMNEVGRRFGEGRMFLPQVVKTARTMKQAVAILQPVIERQQVQTESRRAGKVVLATVKGDVHDIGKNIVSVVMACNNYDVVDLGVMVSAEEIVSRTIEEKADMIGLSGLITPSLSEMVNVVDRLEEAGISVPVMIGGATTSKMHVALKIAPAYSGPVVWMKDASQNPVMAARLMADKNAVKEEVDAEYAQMRQQYSEQQRQLMSIDEARKKKTNYFET